MSSVPPKHFSMYGKNRNLRQYFKNKINNTNLGIIQDYALALSDETSNTLQLTKNIFDKAPGSDYFFEQIEELLGDCGVVKNSPKHDRIRYKMRWTEYLPKYYLQNIINLLYHKQNQIDRIESYAVHIGYSWCKKFHRDISRFRVWVFANDKQLCNQYQNYGKQIKFLCQNHQLPCLKWMYNCTEELSNTAAFFLSINYLEAQIFVPHVIDALYDALSTQTLLLMHLNELSTAV